MGIHNLNLLLKENNEEGIRKAHIADYKGKRIAIDFMNYLYKLLYRIKNENKAQGYYLILWCKMIHKLRKQNIVPVFVFDGKAPAQKSAEIKKRMDVRAKTQERVDELINDINQLVGETNIDISVVTDQEINEITDGFIVPEPELDVPESDLDAPDPATRHDILEKMAELQKLDKRCLYPTPEHFTKSKQLFDILGIPYVCSHREADDMCGFLARNGFIDACLSEDTDMMAHGVPVVLREFNSISGKLVEYNLDKICSDLSLTYSQFVDVCILMGNDYIKIRGIGPKTAYNYIKNNGSYEKAKDEILKKHKLPEEFDYESLFQIFTEFECMEEYFERVVDVDLVLRDVNKKELSKFLKKEGLLK